MSSTVFNASNQTIFVLQGLEKRNYQVLALDVYYALMHNKPGEDPLTPKELGTLIRAFKQITTARHATIIVFCSLQQQGPFWDVMNANTNIPAELGIWYRTNAVSTNQYCPGFSSAAEGLLFGFHDFTTVACTARGTKADWQRVDRNVQNVFPAEGLSGASAVRRCQQIQVCFG